MVGAQSSLEPLWRVPEHRECTHCGEMRIDFMVKNNKSKGGLARKCRRCNVRQNKEWRDRYPTLKPKYDKEYRLKNKDKIRKSDRKWKSENRDKVYASKAKRRALQFKATIEIFNDTDIFTRDGYVCYLCGALTSPSLPAKHPLKSTIEHKIPLVRGGDHSLENCATACWKCNGRKHTMTTEEYLQAVEEGLWGTLE